MPIISSSEDERPIQETLPPDCYSTHIPNRVFTLNLSAHDFSLLAYLIYICDSHYQVVRNLKEISIISGISESQIEKSLNKLSQRFSEIGNKPVILIKKTSGLDVSADFNCIILFPEGGMI